jgi:LAS superfamily LD-carboxypeptidase LdcB
MVKKDGFSENMLVTINQNKMHFKRYISQSIILTFFSLVACAQGNNTADPNNLSDSTKKVLPSNQQETNKNLPVSGASSNSAVSSEITADFLMGKFEYRKHPDFEKVPSEMSSKDIYIQKKALASFTQMRNAALKDGVSLTIISGARNFSEQRGIWERKWEKESAKMKDPKEIALKILLFSSMPSTSRHHWGTDIDINSLETSYFRSGKGLKEYNWLNANGPKYGFYQVYTSKEKGRTGYSEEPWHWSYLPLATDFLAKYNSLIKVEDIKGFKGSETAVTIDVINKYVNGIEKY